MFLHGGYCIGHVLLQLFTSVPVKVVDIISGNKCLELTDFPNPFERFTSKHLPDVDLTFQIKHFTNFPQRSDPLCFSTRLCDPLAGFSEHDCDWLRILMSQKSFSGSSSQTLFFGGDK